jgi:hypothetical protein
MELWQKIVEAYPELADNQYTAFNNEIILQDNSDGSGAYIAKWEYSQPLPESLTQYMRGSN